MVIFRFHVRQWDPRILGVEGLVGWYVEGTDGPSNSVEDHVYT